MEFNRRWNLLIELNNSTITIDISSNNIYKKNNNNSNNREHKRNPQ